MNRDTPYQPKPMQECDVQLAIKITQICKRYGSISAFYEHLEKKREAKARKLVADQQRRIMKAWIP